MRVYALMSGQLVLYVGKTKTSLVVRARHHMCIDNRTCSRHIPDYMEWEIRLLEECSDGDSIGCEQKWYDTLNPLYNNNRPGNSRSDYGRIYQQRARSTQEGRDKLNAAKRLYREKIKKM